MLTQLAAREVVAFSDLTPFEKGYLFEEFITRLFSDHFKIVKWRESVETNDPVLLRDCEKPDLEIIFGYRKYKFAVECKWRRDFFDEQIEWASAKQIQSYQDFENQRRIPVFIAIGIGGYPSHPEQLFVTPLRNIENYTTVSKNQLIPYERKPTRKFYLDECQRSLF